MATYITYNIPLLDHDISLLLSLLCGFVVSFRVFSCLVTFWRTLEILELFDQLHNCANAS